MILRTPRSTQSRSSAASDVYKRQDEDFIEILQSHVVNPAFMYQDDFYGFFNDRKERILDKIEKAMGKTIVREQAIAEEGIYINDQEENEDVD